MKVTHDDLLDIIAEASFRLHTEIKRAYRSGEIKKYLSSIGMLDLIPEKEDSPLYDTNPDGKIIIIGDGRIKENIIYGCLKEFNIPKKRVEIHLDYKELKNFSFKSLQYNPNYRLILLGPAPHSGRAKEEKSSIITQIENDDGYPKVVRLTDAHGLKITRTSLKNAVEKEIRNGYLAV